MTRFASVAGAVAGALVLHAVLLLWPLAPRVAAPPPTIAVSVVTSTRTDGGPPGPTVSPPRRAPASTPPRVPADDPTPVLAPEPGPPAAEGPPAQADPGPGVPGPTAVSGTPEPAPPGAGAGSLQTEASAVDLWAVAVRGRVDAKKTYPYAARAQGLQGKATVAFTIAAGGQVTDLTLSASSGYPTLDRAALAAVAAAAPYPRPPESLGPGPWPFTVTLVFTLR